MNEHLLRFISSWNREVLCKCLASKYSSVLRDLVSVIPLGLRTIFLSVQAVTMASPQNDAGSFNWMSVALGISNSLMDQQYQ